MKMNNEKKFHWESTTPYHSYRNHLGHVKCVCFRDIYVWETVFLIWLYRTLQLYSFVRIAMQDTPTYCINNDQPQFGRHVIVKCIIKPYFMHQVWGHFDTNIQISCCHSACPGLDKILLQSIERCNCCKPFQHLTHTHTHTKCKNI